MLCLLLTGMTSVFSVNAAETETENTQTSQKAGWKTTTSGTKYRYANGSYAKSKWLTVDGKKYYVQSNGVRAEKKWLKLNNKYYYFLPSGGLAVNRMVTSGSKCYYVNGSGVRVKSMLIQKSGAKYYFDSQGVRVQNKWIKLSGKYYYFGSNGAMAVNKWVGNYYAGPTGARLTDCVKDGYYLNASGKKTVKKYTGKYILLGDSRMVGMSKAVSNADTKYIAKVSMGYNWLKTTAGTTLGYYLKLNPDVDVVLALGVNDLGNIQAYISYYKSLIKKYPKTRFYILSVNPVNETVVAKHGYTIKNSQIRAFNNKLYAAFKSRYVNSYKYMMNNGFATRDGLHYTTSTYKEIYDYIVSKVQ